MDRTLRVALLIGAALWLLLLAVGFVAPGGWRWGMAGPVGHTWNYMISLWFVALVAAPILAAANPLERTPAIQLYLLGILGIAVSTIRAEPLGLLNDGVPLSACALSAGLVFWAHPSRSRIWQG
jgi:hypothetical protein